MSLPRDGSLLVCTVERAHGHVELARWELHLGLDAPDLGTGAKDRRRESLDGRGFDVDLAEHLGGGPVRGEDDDVARLVKLAGVLAPRRAVVDTEILDGTKGARIEVGQLGKQLRRCNVEMDYGTQIGKAMRRLLGLATSACRSAWSGIGVQTAIAVWDSGSDAHEPRATVCHGGPLARNCPYHRGFPRHPRPCVDPLPGPQTVFSQLTPERAAGCLGC